MSTDSAAIVAFKEGGEPGRNRTCDPLLRRQMLYPTELRALELDCSSAGPREKDRESARPPVPRNAPKAEPYQPRFDTARRFGAKNGNQAVRPTRAPNRMLRGRAISTTIDVLQRFGYRRRHQPVLNQRQRNGPLLACLCLRFAETRYIQSEVITIT
jgi:hypothetical protein